MSDAITRLASYYNGDAYDATTNPGGMDNNGHQFNFIPAIQDVAAVGVLTKNAATTALAGFSQQTAWVNGVISAAGSCTFTSADTFTISDAAASWFYVNELVQADCGTDGIKFGIVQSVSGYVVTLTLMNGNLTSNLKHVFGIGNKAIFVANYTDIASAVTATGTYASQAAASATSAGNSSSSAAASAAAAAGSAAIVNVGWGQEQLVQHHMLGTCAYIDKLYIDGYYTWTPGTIANGSQAHLEIVALNKISGATVGDYVKASCMTDLQRLQLTGEVYKDGCLRLVLSNTTGSSVTMASSIYHVRIEKLYALR